MMGAKPSAKRELTQAATLSVENLTSGIKTAAAPPAIPACRAIHPAWRPITSTTSARWCDSAVVCRRSIASTAIFTEVSNPNV